MANSAGRGKKPTRKECMNRCHMGEDECDFIRRMIKEYRASGNMARAPELKAYGNSLGCIVNGLDL